jgi:hypothetical protein
MPSLFPAYEGAPNAFGPAFAFVRVNGCTFQDFLGIAFLD